MVNRFDKWFNRNIDGLIRRLKEASSARVQWIVALTLLFTGLVGVYLTGPWLSTNSLSLGRHTTALFIPIFLSMAFYTYSTLIGQQTKRNKLLSFAIYFLLTLPLVNHLNMEVSHLDGDDSSETSDVAHYMIENKTLYGVYLGKEFLSVPLSEFRSENELPVFKLQYGLRYVLAGSILVFGGENRWIHVFWLFVYLTLSIFVLDAISARGSPALSFWGATVALLSIPYACKMILMTMNEPYAVMAMALFLIFFSQKRLYLAAVGLALVPFFRQNMAIFSFLAFVFVLRSKDIRIWMTYGIVFLFPIWHNLFYAGKIAFFTNGSINGVAQSKFLSVGDLRGFDAFLHNTLHYFGACSLLSNLGSYVIAWLFIPLSTALLIRSFFFTNKIDFVKYVLLAGSAIGPAIIFGSDTYPRFEYVNLLCIFMAYSAYHFKFKMKHQ